jgi:hypothetical protein
MNAGGRTMRFLLFIGILTITASASAAPTFYKDVLPILQQRCQTCHRTGEIGPMPFVTYQETRPWAKAIREAVLLKKMPPWQADSKHGKFSNDLSLTLQQIEAIVGWIDAGAPEGSANDAPPPPQFADGWRIAQPDAVFEMSEEYLIPAAGTVEYQYFSVPTNLREDKWVSMAEVRPSQRALVHHAIVMVRAPHENGYFGRGQYLAGYAPGMSPQIWKPGQARLIKAGSSLIFQMHYTANGKPALDRTRIGLVFAKEPTVSQIVAMRAANMWFSLPAGESSVRVDASTTIPEPVSLVAMRAHMHLRGSSFEFRAVYPTGESEVLLSIPRYDFNWQPYYYLEKPVPLPAGTRIECTAYFDNSANNPRNPDPGKEVRWGDQSWEEMMIGWFDVAVDATALGGAG